MRTKIQIASAILSGALACVSFPTVAFGWRLPEMGWLGWIALVPLILALRGAGPRRAFSLAFVFGIVMYGGSLYWIYRALNTFGRLPPLTSALVLALMVVILAAYIGIVPMFTRIIASRWRGEQMVVLPVVWVGVEFLRSFWPVGGFPWSNVAMSQWRMLPAIQVADVAGVYAVIFLVVWVNAFVAEAVARLRGERVEGFAAKSIATGLIVTAAFGYGFARLYALDEGRGAATEVKVGIIQANIPQEEKWETEKASANLAVLRKATRSLRDAAVELVVWPEASFPWLIGTESRSMDPRALGFDSYEFGELPFLLMGAITETPEGSYHNSALLFDAKGEVKGRYDKAHLVPFGEYVPYARVLSFARKLTEPAGNFLAGTSYEPLVAGSTRIGPLICYEDIFPEISRRLTSRGAEFLANLTNDAWYGESSAAYQHLALSVFRAVENRRYLIRATNTGVSAVVEPSGEATMETGLFQRAVIVAPVGRRTGLSTYTRLGDWFAMACMAYTTFGLAMAAGMAVRVRIRDRRRRT
jgi:apolipoprotein N-acyltransferase